MRSDWLRQLPSRSCWRCSSSTVDSIQKSAASLLAVAGKVAGNTSYIPQLQATAPVLGLIVEEALVQDDYMNALTDGFGGK